MKEQTDRLQLLGIIWLPFILAVIFSLHPQADQVSKLWQDIQTLETRQQPELLINRYRALLKQQPWQLPWWEKLAALEYSQNDFQGAVESLNKLAALQPLNVEQEMLLARSYQQSGETELSLNTWKMITLRDDLQPENFPFLLENQESQRDFDSAYILLQRWAALSPNDSEIQYKLGLYDLIFNPQGANEVLVRAYQINSTFIERIKRIEKALPAILNEEDETFRLVLCGKTLSNEGEWLLASAAFEKATQINPGYAEAWALLGNSYSFLGENGFPALSKAQTLNPDSIVVQAFLAVYWRQQGDFIQSEQIFRKLALQEPEEAYWKYELGKTKAQAGDLQNALDYYQQAILTSSQDIFYWKELINFSLNYSYLVETEGMRAAREALTIAPDDAESNDLAGMVYLRLENYPNAERFLIKASKLQPYSALVHLHLGQLYYLKGENNLAYFYLQNALKFSQNDAIRQAAQDILNSIASMN